MQRRPRARLRLQRDALARRAAPLRDLRGALRRARAAAHRGGLLRPLAGNTEEAIIGGWLGVEGDELAALVEERIDRYVRAGGRIDDARRRSARRSGTPPRGCPSRSCPAPTGGRSSRCSSGRALADVVSAIVAADDVTRGKPDPEGYLRALERARRRPRARATSWRSRTPRRASRRRALRVFAASRCAGRSPTSGSRRRTGSSTRSTSSSSGRSSDDLGDRPPRRVRGRAREHAARVRAGDRARRGLRRARRPGRRRTARSSSSTTSTSTG